MTRMQIDGEPQLMPLSLRHQQILACIHPATQIGVEIGPLASPIVTRQMGDIRYVDHATTAELQIKYAHDPSVPLEQIVAVDYTWGDQSLAELLAADAPVDYVIASHVIEHVPNLIGWLQEICAILKPGGILSLAIPDKRCCFDYDRPLTTTADLVDAHLRNLRKPSLKAIYEYFAAVVSYRGQISWVGLPVESELVPLYTPQQAYQRATEVMQTGRYEDVHCWVFTPTHFLQVLQALITLDLLDFQVAGFQDTIANEFFVSLMAIAPPAEPEPSRAAQLQSLQDAAQTIHFGRAQPAAIAPQFAGATAPPLPSQLAPSRHGHERGHVSLRQRLHTTLHQRWDDFNHLPWVVHVKAYPAIATLRQWRKSWRR